MLFILYSHSRNTLQLFKNLFSDACTLKAYEFTSKLTSCRIEPSVLLQQSVCHWFVLWRCLGRLNYEGARQQQTVHLPVHQQLSIGSCSAADDALIYHDVIFQNSTIILLVDGMRRKQDSRTLGEIYLTLSVNE